MRLLIVVSTGHRLAQPAEVLAEVLFPGRVASHAGIGVVTLETRVSFAAPDNVGMSDSPGRGFGVLRVVAHIAVVPRREFRPAWVASTTRFDACLEGSSGMWVALPVVLMGDVDSVAGDAERLL